MSPESGLRIRIAQPQDCEPLARLHHLSHTISFAEFADKGWLDGRQFPDYLNFWTAYLLDQPSVERTWLAEESGRVIGTLTIMAMLNSSEIFRPSTVGTIRDDKAACLRLMYVHPEHLRAGVGRRLVDRADKFIEKQGYQLVTLITHVANFRARGFYERMGWQVDEVLDVQVEEFFEEPPGMRRRARYIRCFDQ